MAKKSFNAAVVSLSLLGLGSSCLGLDLSPQAKPNQRISVIDRDQLPGAKVPSMTSNLDDGEMNACLTMEAMSSFTEASGEYGMLRSLDLNGKKLEGRVNVPGYPVIRIQISDGTPTSPQDFKAVLKDKRADGQINGFEYFIARNILAGNFFGLQIGAWRGQVNGTLEKAFPGIFGSSTSMDESLALLMIRKALAGRDLDRDVNLDVLLERMPLFPSSRSWKDWADDLIQSQSSVVAAFGAADLRTQEGKTARLCGLNLLHRGFAQLLSLKGYQSPRLERAVSGDRYLKKLDSKGWSYFDRLGAFSDVKTGKRVVLSPEDIGSYRPECKAFWPTEETPVDEESSSVAFADLEDYLHLLRGTSAFFELTHPGAPWTRPDEGQPYLVGDFTETNNASLLPFSAHSLALGLTTMGIKNLAGFNLVKINAQGKRLTEGESAKGLVLHQGEVVRLADVAHLAEVVTRLVHSLGYFKQKTQAQWEKMNPLYTEKTLADLMGRQMYSEDQLRCLREKHPSAQSCDEAAPRAEAYDCSPEAASSTMAKLLGRAKLRLAKEGYGLQPAALEALYAQIKRLEGKHFEDESLYAKMVAIKLPLVMLMNRLAGQTAEQCVAALDWDFRTGKTEVLSPCDEQTVDLYRRTLRVMAAQNRSRALLTQAENY